MIFNLILFILVLLSSFIIVQIGGIAFELTGLEWSIAKFQALSCFSGTGFTTKEAELITRNPKRRRIATILMMLGKAGLITLIATLANTIRPVISGNGEFKDILPLINLGVIIISILVIYKLLIRTKFAKSFSDWIHKRALKTRKISSITMEELTLTTGGYGVIRVEITEKNSLTGKTLKETNLNKKNDISVLAIESEKKVIPNPSLSFKIKTGDQIICFGKLDQIKKEFS